MALVGTATDLAGLVRERGPAVVLTGAGMSTASGIPDFRSARGMWAEVDPFEVASIDAFRRDPLRVWRWYGPRIDALLAAEPNPGHAVLAALERAGHVTAVITQNIDTLHTRAGSVEVVEVHGSIRRFECLRCQAQEVTLNDVLRQLETREAPECVECGAILKPGVVMFGEILPPGAFERAEQLAREARVLLAVGTSLQVWPVAGLPREALRTGGTLAIVNAEATPYDDEASVLVRGRADAVLSEMATALGASMRGRESAS